MKLRGSCHCGKVSFTVNSVNFYPFQLCYCSICRKTQGGGGFAINLGADAKTLRIKGKKYISVYKAKVTNPDKRAYQSSGERNFCKVCSSGLWLFDPEWPDLVHPFASVIDSDLPPTPHKTHLMVEFKASWVRLDKKKGDKVFQRYPKESIAEWHDRVIRKK
jgi:hypothetical protein